VSTTEPFGTAGTVRDGPVVVLAYDGIAADEAGLIVQILTGAGIEVIIATVGTDPVTSFHGRVVAHRTAAGLGTCKALVVPGGMGVRRAADDEAFIAAIARLAADATWLAATSTGSVLLAAAGVVDGARATTHWLAGELITDRGLELVRESFVEHGRLLTASGVVSAPRLAFRLVGALAGVEAEAKARSQFRRPPTTDPRYVRLPRGWRRWFGSKRLGGIDHPMDPSGSAEIVFLDLDLDDNGSDGRGR